MAEQVDQSDEAQAVSCELVEGNGYSVLEGAISPELAAEVRALVIDNLDDAADAADGVVALRELMDISEVFSDLVTNDRVLGAAHALLGADAALGAFTAKVLMPDCKVGGLHVDWPYWAMEYEMPVSPPLMMQVIWMMEPFSEENGGTWIAPGSQLWGGKPDIDRFKEHRVQATGNAGDALVSHGLLWHQTAVNRSPRPRVAILINYCQFTVQPMVPLGPFDEAFKKRVKPQLGTLLGFDRMQSMRKRIAR